VRNSHEIADNNSGVLILEISLKMKNIIFYMFYI